MGISINEFNKLGEQPERSKEFDGKYEEYQKNLNPQDDIILEGRMSFYCQPASFKVFLTVSDEEAGKRIMKDHRDTDAFATLEEAIQATKKRNESDVQRYEKLYGVDFSDMTQFDLVIDTTALSPEQTVDQVVSAFQQFQQQKSDTI